MKDLIIPPNPAIINDKITDFPGVNILLEGPAGSGKTFAIKSLVATGLDVFVLMLESGLETLKGAYVDNDEKIPENLHWHILKSADVTFAEMEEVAKKINTASFEMLTKMIDPKRGMHNQWVSVFSVLNNFVDQRTGKSYGPVNLWKADKALAIDGLTGLNNAAMSLVTGGKPVKNQADWGMAQGQVEGLLRKLCDGCGCHYLQLAHVERETDPVLGGTKLMAATLGKALAPKIPAMFSDVILAVREGDKWTWDTANPMADLKARNLPVRAGQAPDFSQIIQKWRKRAEAE